MESQICVCGSRRIRTFDQRIRFHGWTWTNVPHAYVLLFCKPSTNWDTWNTIRFSELLCIQSAALPLRHTPPYFQRTYYYLWKFIFQKKIINIFIYFDRNVGIEPTPRTGMFVFYLLNLFRIIICINKYISQF